jgi:hypothetical protein
LSPTSYLHRGGRLPEQKAIEIAEKVAPYRHPKFSTIKISGDPNAPVHVNADASSEEVRAEIIRRLIRLAPVLELEAVPELNGTALAEVAKHERSPRGCSYQLANRVCGPWPPPVKQKKPARVRAPTGAKE